MLLKAICCSRNESVANILITQTAVESAKVSICYGDGIPLKIPMLQIRNVLRYASSNICTFECHVSQLEVYLECFESVNMEGKQ